jgi:hypothetical protein
MKRDLPSVRLLSLRPAAIAVALFGTLSMALAADPPAFRRGLWEFKRTVETQGASAKPVTLTNKKCTDPSADMKNMQAMLAKQGCKVSPASAKGNRFTFTSECTVQGTTLSSRSVMTVDSDSSYKVEVSSKAGNRSTKELLVAKRVGNC